MRAERKKDDVQQKSLVRTKLKTLQLPVHGLKVLGPQREDLNLCVNLHRHHKYTEQFHTKKLLLSEDLYKCS